MAIIKCKECGNDVSDKAISCPECGFNVKEDQEKVANIVATVFAIVVLGFVAFWIYGKANDFADYVVSVEEKPWNERDNSSYAYSYIQREIGPKLYSPGSAKWPGIIDRISHVSKSDDTYTINSYVDSHNRFGALIRTNFTAQVKQLNESEWELVYLRLE